jgi:hypothetical protein
MTKNELVFVRKKGLGHPWLDITGVNEPIPPDGFEIKTIDIDELIGAIEVNKANLLHIAETGKINGTLRESLKTMILKVVEQVSTTQSIAV